MTVPGADVELAAQIGRQTIATKFALHLSGQRQIGIVGHILQPQRQEDIGGWHLVGTQIDGTHTVFLRPDQHTN